MIDIILIIFEREKGFEVVVLKRGVRVKSLIVPRSYDFNQLKSLFLAGDRDDTQDKGKK